MVQNLKIAESGVFILEAFRLTIFHGPNFCAENANNFCNSCTILHEE